jgi:drug/metabolite transporter (DMT)-like permease
MRSAAPARTGAARWQLLAAAALFSTGGAAIKGVALSGWQIAGLRSGIAAVALAFMMPQARRRAGRGPWLVACAYAGTLVLYVLANKHTTAANAIFLQSTAPLYVLLLSRYWLRETIRRTDLVFMAALAGGLALFFGGMDTPTRTAPDPFLGNVLGAASAVFWALTVAGLRWIARAEGAGRPAGAAAGATLRGNVVVFAACLPLALPLEGASTTDWMLLGYLGVFQIALAYVFMTAGVRGVAALEGSLLLLIEPVLNTVWAWLFHGEMPGPWSAAGALVILAATVVHSMHARRRLPLVAEPGPGGRVAETRNAKKPAPHATP